VTDIVWLNSSIDVNRTPANFGCDATKDATGLSSIFLPDGELLLNAGFQNNYICQLNFRDDEPPDRLARRLGQFDPIGGRAFKYERAATTGMDEDTLDARLAAVERTLTDSETAPASLADEATLQRRLTAVESELDALETRLADAEGELTAVRAHVGDARRVDAETERIAERALALARETETDDATPTQNVPVLSRLFARLRALTP
jgi:hypothetical protein